MAKNCSRNFRLSIMAFPIILLLILLHVGNSSGSDNSYIASKCEEGNGVNTLELRTLFLGMGKAAGKTSYYALNTSGLGHGREVMYGAYLCRGDVSLAECSGCVSAAITHLFVHCKNAKSGVIWYEMCLVRFSTVAFLGTVNEEESIYKWSKRKVTTDKRSYLNLAGSLIQNMSVEFNLQSDISGSYFKYQTATLGGSYVKVHTMAECTPDLSPYDCQMCLQILTDDIPALCSGSIGCWMLNPACIARYSSYAFLKTPVTSPPPPPPPVPNVFSGPTPSSKRERSLVLGVVIPLSIGLAILVISSLIYLHRKRSEATTYVITVPPSNKGVPMKPAVIWQDARNN